MIKKAKFKRNAASRSGIECYIWSRSGLTLSISHLSSASGCGYWRSSFSGRPFKIRSVTK